jgi:hypothetical protein
MSSYINCEQMLQPVAYPYTVRINIVLNQCVSVEKLEKAGVRVPKDQSNIKIEKRSYVKGLSTLLFKFYHVNRQNYF